MKLKVHEAARQTGVSAKTLRYYHKIGLLQPEEVSETGYRFYGQKELARLREILILRELGFPLKEIAVLLDVPEGDKVEAFRRQKELLEQKRRRLDDVIALVESMMKGEDPMNFEAFCKEDQEAARTAYAREVKERWGSTEAYKESQRREAGRTERERQAAQREMDSLLDRFAAMVKNDPAGPGAQALVKEWQACISKWYYDCTDEILAGLGQMYTADPRFAETIDSHGPGTAEFLSRAISLFCGK